MRRIVHGRAGATVVAVAVVVGGAACSKAGNKAADSAPIAAAKADTAPPSGTKKYVDLDTIIGHPDRIQALKNNLATTGASYDVDVPSKPTPRPCTTVTLKLTATTGESGYKYTDLTDPANVGIPIGTIENTSDTCTPKGIALPPHAVAQVFFRTKNNMTKEVTFDVTNGTQLHLPHPNLNKCPPNPDPNPPAPSDAFSGKPLTDSSVLCNHKPTLTLNGAPAAASNGLVLIDYARSRMPAPPITDWTVWFACGNDCCYADGVRDPRDSTAVDSAGRRGGTGGAPTPKKAKPNSGAAN